MNIHARKPLPPMTAEEFLIWGEAQTEGRYELVDGQVIAMAPERSQHAVLKGAAYRVLYNAIKAAGLPCKVYPDGMTVITNKNRAREPDAAVQCGPQPHPHSLQLDAPVIVVEVLSPSTRRSDAIAKLADYFSVPSVRHYLIVDPDPRSVTHHTRDDAGVMTEVTITSGAIDFAPPGFSILCEDLFADI